MEMTGSQIIRLVIWTFVLVAVGITAVKLLYVRRRAGHPVATVLWSGTVPADQSLPFSAEDFLSKGGLYTVFDFEVGCGNNPKVDLTSFTLTAAEGQNALAGDFTGPSFVEDSTMYAFTNTSQFVTIDFTKFPEGKLTVVKDKPATFTVVALPRAYSGLSVTFTGDPIGTRTLKLSYSDGRPITFRALKRHRVYGLSLPD